MPAHLSEQFLIQTVASVSAKKATGSAMTSLCPPVTAGEYNNTGDCFSVLSSFKDAVVELSEQERVSSSKATPLLKMIEYSVLERHSLCDHSLRSTKEKTCGRL